MTDTNQSEKTLNREEIRAQFEEILDYVEGCYKNRIPLHQIEQGILSQLLGLGRVLLIWFFVLCGDGDRGETLTLDNGRKLRRLKGLYKKEYLSIFGAFLLFRAVYGTREKQKIECVPLDAELSLPESKFSYLLQDWDQELAVNAPYVEVNRTIQKILGLDQSVHSLERINYKMSESTEAYWKQIQPPAPEEEGGVMVIQTDCKGVVIRSESQADEPKSPEISLEKKGQEEKSGKKKMALVGAAYTVDPYIRTPEEVLDALFRGSASSTGTATTRRPKPVAKHVRASLLRNGAGTMEPSYDEIYGWLSEEVALRNPDSNKPLVCVMDGQAKLWDALALHFPEEGRVEILDIIHATSYIWDATHLFYDRGTPQATEFAKDRILRLLQGEVDGVIRGLRWKGTYDGLSKKKREKLDKICSYLGNNRHRMKYDEYLAAGYPIASGVIEGACRNVIVDRMEHSGMRWVLHGAHAMLGLRCIHLSDAWDDFMQFRIQSEHERLYAGYAANDDVFDEVKAA